MNKLMSVVVVTFACVQVYAASEGSLSMDLAKPGSSSSNRLDKSFTLLASPIGLGPSQNAEAGLVAGIFISPKTLIQLEAGDGNTSEGFSFFGTSTVKSHTSSASIAIKHFVGNSFYVKGGVDNRRINYSESYKSTWNLFGTPSTYEDNVTFEAESWSASVVIGNQWQWENFTLGCDWVGIAAPFTSEVKSESYATTSTDKTSIQRDLADREKRKLKDMAFQGLKFYLGASF